MLSRHLHTWGGSGQDAGVLVLGQVLEGLCGNGVQLLAAGGGDVSALGVVLLADEVCTLQLLQDVTHEAARGLCVVWAAVQAALLGAVDGGERTEAKATLQVDLADDRGGTDVIPVRVLWGELAGGTRLNDIVPLW